eukprot:5956339-Pyramimonas_sp.AAC.1
MSDLEASAGLQTFPPAGGAPGLKKVKIEARQMIQSGKADDEIISQLVLAITRLVLADNRAIVELAATVYTTWALDCTEDGVTDVMETACRRYQEISQDMATKRKGGEQVDFKGRGPPHLHVFLSGLIFLAQKETGWGKELKETYGSELKRLLDAAAGRD